MKQIKIERIIKTICIVAPILIASIKEYNSAIREDRQCEKIDMLEQRLSKLEDK